MPDTETFWTRELRAMPIGTVLRWDFAYQLTIRRETYAFWRVTVGSTVHGIRPHSTVCDVMAVERYIHSYAGR